jgi:hypothetical protein
MRGAGPVVGFTRSLAGSFLDKEPRTGSDPSHDPVQCSMLPVVPATVPWADLVSASSGEWVQRKASIKDRRRV